MKKPWYARLYLWLTLRLYNELAWAYDAVAWIVSAGQWGRWRRLALKHAQGQRVLEVGFGTGELLIEMARRGGTPVGLEYSPAMQRVTAAKLRRRGLVVTRLRARAQQMPFATGAFDSIISTFPAGYITDPAALEEIARLLRPAGSPGATAPARLIVVGLTVVAEHPLLARLLPVFYAPSRGVVEEYWRGLAAEAGLEARVVYERSGLVTLPIILAERTV